jgi:thiol-disulfide isomerase/thioredoxin
MGLCQFGRLACVSGLVWLAAGCGPQQARHTASKTTAPTASQIADIDVTIGERSDLDRLVAGHKGKVVLVDFWATWCGPCVQQFPHTVDLSRANRDHLAVISVSMDEPEDVDRVRKFLRDQEADFPNLLSKYGVGQESFDAFDIQNGSIPHYKIFDRSGKLRHQLDNNDAVDALVDALLIEQ